MDATTIRGVIRNGWQVQDDIGLKAADEQQAVDTYDIHATILHLMGLNHLQTTFVNNGRAERPTVNFGKVVTDILT
jgi:hypothetical protein